VIRLLVVEAKGKLLEVEVLVVPKNEKVLKEDKLQFFVVFPSVEVALLRIKKLFIK
jgi:hypothetical protein